MKYYLSCAILALCLFCNHPSKAAYKLRVQHRSTTTALTSTTPGEATVMTNLAESRYISANQKTGLPRGRGTGKRGEKAFLFGWLSIFPVLGIPFAALAYYNGFHNVGRIKKKRGFAIAGIALATLGLAFTIAIFAFG